WPSSLTASGLTSSKKTWFGSSTVFSRRSATTAPGSVSTRLGCCKSSERRPVLRDRATRTDMRVLTRDEIDRERESRTTEVAAMSATLLELEDHPGLEHVRLYPPIGMTAKRWAAIEKSLAQLWEDLGRMTSILDSARMVRARRSNPDDD